jgi:hypothetical protein
LQNENCKRFTNRNLQIIKKLKAPLLIQAFRYCFGDCPFNSWSWGRFPSISISVMIYIHNMNKWTDRLHVFPATVTYKRASSARRSQSHLEMFFNSMHHWDRVYALLSRTLRRRRRRPES